MQRFSAITSRAVSDERLTDSEYRTLGAIAAHADKDGWCYPSQGHIAKLRGLSRQTINTHVKKLAELGYLNVEHRQRDDGGQTSNMYQVRLDFPNEEGGVSNPDLTGGVKSKSRQGGVKSRLDTNTSDITPQTKAKGETHLIGLAEYFCEIAGRKMPYKYDSDHAIKLWWEPLVEIHAQQGTVKETKAAMYRAVQAAKEAGLTITTPKSLINMAAIGINGQNGYRTPDGVMVVSGR